MNTKDTKDTKVKTRLIFIFMSFVSIVVIQRCERVVMQPWQTR